MFFNGNHIPAVPIREEQRLSEEEELARQLKREARIFFPDKKLPDLQPEEKPQDPEEKSKEQNIDRESCSGDTRDSKEREEERIAKNSKPLQSERPGNVQPANGESGLRIGAEGKDVRPRLNIQDLKRGIRLKVVLDKPLGLMSWKEDHF